jgi:SAM-dependent methyltransferase
MNCFACDSENVVFVCNVNGYKIHRCMHCGLIFTDPMPDDKTITEFYQGFLFDKPNVNKLKSKVTNRKKELLATIGLTEKACSGKSFFDYGGGTGLTYAVARECGFETYYYDIDNQAIQFAKNNLELKTESIISEPEKDSRKFDIIMCDNVIEHVKNPDVLIRMLFNKLVAGGVLIFKTPRASNTETLLIFSVWFLVYLKKVIFGNDLKTSIDAIFVHRYWHAEPPRHLFAFSDESMKLLVQKNCGNDCEIITDSYSTPYFKYSIADILLSIKNPFLRVFLFINLLPFIAMEFVLALFRIILVKLKVISMSGLIVKVRKPL